MLLCGCVCVSMCVHKMCRSVQIKVREVILVIKIRIHHYAHRRLKSLLLRQQYPCISYGGPDPECTARCVGLA